MPYKYLCLLAVFKNEAHILKEWVEHYIKEGVDKFFLINNNSTDNFYDILSPYINNGIVTLNSDNRSHSQIAIYNDYINVCKQYKWVIVCDLDEFIYARKSFKRIKKYLKTLNNNVSQVCIPWKMFGSNGYDSYDKPQPSSVIHSFTKRQHNKGLINSKSIVRTEFLSRFDIHEHHVNGGIQYNELNNKNFMAINEDILQNTCLHLNHYAIQSFEWFMRVKVTRGDNASSSANNIRNEEYFRAYDNNHIEDLELANKSY
jgi:hypothetical protein